MTRHDVMNTSKGKYWDASCNPIVNLECKCEVDNCWVRPMAKRYGWKSGWYQERMNKISVKGKAKVFAMCWLGDVGWKDVSGFDVQSIFRYMVYNEVERLENSVPKHTFLFLTKWPENLYRRMGDFIDIKNTNIWIGTTITGANQIKDFDRLQHLLSFDGFNTWVSVEPLMRTLPHSVQDLLVRNNQVIVGHSSGGKCNSDIIGISNIVHHCQDVDTPVFVKQLHINGKLSKNINDWPEDLRVRELEWEAENE